MASQQLPQLNIDRYVVIHVATTCDEHGVYVTKDSAEVIELGWILVDANSLEEVRNTTLPRPKPPPKIFLVFQILLQKHSMLPYNTQIAD
jgi:hypothetical protein